MTMPFFPGQQAVDPSFASVLEPWSRPLSFPLGPEIAELTPLRKEWHLATRRPMDL